jgi:hypothetical protein
MCDAYSRTYVLKAKNGHHSALADVSGISRTPGEGVRTCRIHYGDSSRTVCRTSIGSFERHSRIPIFLEAIFTWGSDEKIVRIQSAKRIQ